MAEIDPAQEIVDLVVTAFPNREERADPQRIEALLRPFAPITAAFRERVTNLVYASCGFRRSYDVDHWLEAQVLVNDQDPEHENAIKFILRDTCTCVLPHLPAAIMHAKGPVDPRILALLKETTEDAV